MTQKANRLINSKSPYLIQHAYNPVDWFEWCDEAFEKAGKEDKPVFLSIGYSTCHWCHVMAHESFENEEIASYMNENFVCIKVDREERPDIDNIFMLVCQMMNRNCGWPLTIIMDADKKPFFAGTYLPPVSTMGRIGLHDLLQSIMNYWKNNRAELYKTGDAVIENLKSISSGGNYNSSNLDENMFHDAYEELSAMFDKIEGGFGIERKFPMPHFLQFLLRYGKAYGDKYAFEMLELTLKKMRYGGIYDQIGYGFHRYSVDSKFLLPHFEKMLYDQAGMLLAYTEAYQFAKNSLFADTVDEIISYLKANLLSDNGGFYSAEDADSNGEEGEFYLWTKDEIIDVLNDDARRFIDLYNIKDEGNFTPETGVNENGLNILHLSNDVVLNEDTKDFINRCRNKLLEVRSRRIKPMLDNKILTDWNGYITAVLAYAGFVFGKKEYINLAENCAGFIIENSVNESGELLHVNYDGKGQIQGMLDDYAFFIYGLNELYFATAQTKYLTEAIRLTKLAIELYYDEENGGFFQTATNSETVLVRQKDISDNAMPSGNSIMMLNLLRLGKMLNNNEFLECAEKTAGFYKEKIYQNPSAYIGMLNALFWMIKGSSEMVVAGRKKDDNYAELLKTIADIYLPFNALLYLDEKRELDELTGWTENIKLNKNHTEVYFCRDYTCKMPVKTSNDLLRVIEDK